MIKEKLEIFQRVLKCFCLIWKKYWISPHRFKGIYSINTCYTVVIPGYGKNQFLPGHYIGLGLNLLYRSCELDSSQDKKDSYT